MAKILVPFDGSAYSSKAIAELQRAGMPSEAEALVFTAAETWMHEPLIWAGIGLSSHHQLLLKTEQDAVKASLRKALRIANEGAKRLKDIFPYWSVRTESAADEPASAIIDTIEVWQPDLVVMGTHGRSAAGRLMFGSISHKVLAMTHANLCLSRGALDAGESRAQVPLRILVALDGSQSSETAFRTVLARTWPPGTALRLVTVADTRVSTAMLYPTGPIRYWVRDDDTDMLEWVERMLEDQKKTAEKKGLIVQARILGGDAKRSILKEAADWGADRIFVGPRGLTGIERAIVGSVTMAIAHHAHCSVEVTHRCWEDDACCSKALAAHRDCMSNERTLR